MGLVMVLLVPFYKNASFKIKEAPEIIDFVKNSFEKFDLKVEINNPYAGGFITRKYGNPLTGVETIQIEICMIGILIYFPLVKKVFVKCWKTISINVMTT